MQASESGKSRRRRKIDESISLNESTINIYHCNTNITHKSPSSTPFVSSLIIPDGAKSQFPIRNLFTTKVVDTFTY